MSAPPLACTVRGCIRPLVREARAYRCAAGHTFDVARAGYVSLLQPQDRKAREPGDTRRQVEARAVLEEAGVGASLVAAAAAWIDRLALPGGAVLVDLGSGTGQGLATLTRGCGGVGVGIDLSVAAATYAARRWPALTWVVANADRRLPLLDGRVDVVLSLHARRNPVECARVLTPRGALLVAVPAADDLCELREALHGVALARRRVEQVIAEHGDGYVLEDRVRVAERRRLDPAALAALAGATYRGARWSVVPRLNALASLEVTFASDLCLLRPRSGAARANAGGR